MIHVVLLAAFVAGISAQKCVPPFPVHSETGDELYRVLLCDLNNAENMAAQISATAQGKFDTNDFFTQLLMSITADNVWLDKLAAGTSNPSGDECVSVDRRIDFDLKNIQGKEDVPVNSPVCPPTSGPALAQYTHQQFGRTLTALANAPAGPNPPGRWQKYVLDLNNGIAAVRIISNTNDANNCVATTKTLANALVGIRSSCGPTQTMG